MKRTTDTEGRQYAGWLWCNYKPILSVRGIKATRVTRSTTELDGDKETRKGKESGGERKRRGRAAFVS